MTPDEKILLIYKARSYVDRPYPEFLHGKMILGVAVADAPWEKHKAILDKPLFDGSCYELEDPFVWCNDEGYHLVAKDMNGNVCGEKFGGVYATSSDGVEWDFKAGTCFYSRKLLFDDGSEKELGNLDRPCILFEEGKPICAYFAVSDGTDGKGFVNCNRTWSMPLKMKTE